MDAADRAELDALRRRAFSPAADIRDDPAALARLIELEDLARAGKTGDQSPAVEPSTAAAAGELSATPGVVVTTADEPVRREVTAPRRALIAGIAVAVAVAVAIGFGTVLARPPAEPVARATATPGIDGQAVVRAADPNAQTLFSIRRIESLGSYMELTADSPAPAFPTPTMLHWAVALGEYWGWELWIAGGRGGPNDEHCILIRRGSETRAQCADLEGHGQGVLQVSIDGDDIPPAAAPAQLARDQRIRFWWLGDGDIQVVQGSFEDG